MSLARMMRMVLWSFFGVRKGAGHQADLASVKLPWVPVMAILLAACFGGLLFGLAKVAITVIN
ncbi:DUF2970 domain-containing protein [Burkholderia pseudomallei]|uniref:DUF2970 domain-containing protein n=1 Tax=Burkholderia pseudomallei TaxID=28450 RepID=UPI00053101F1|nr:DUF2970 domain-containing protein [Burkholderia pseudomallei]KGS74608.1 hypothetical protein X947_5550 [Burkholderia pseudomallei MSHR7334]ONC96338.1 hypothetical protein AQ925_08645 [Burkholderia pseudomallei]ONC98463.1 hypothetical protein AQ927_08785 [Burkholderia pseudomallei]OND00339.1 hypothetical protein AQ926_12355 [Burkholderia pseudomallei]OND14247.1 hypothetical protein AQ928_26840 [Burkholderia pseudomallei]